jgi:hypothetical protein
VNWLVWSLPCYPPHEWLGRTCVCTARGRYCLGFWSGGVLGCTVIVKSHRTHFQVSSVGTDGRDLLVSIVILQRGQIYVGA